MTTLLELFGVALAAFALAALAWWLERATRRPGLLFLIAATIMLVSAGFGFAAGQRLLPACFALQAVAFLYLAHWRRSAARAAGVAAPEA